MDEWIAGYLHPDVPAHAMNNLDPNPNLNLNLPSLPHPRLAAQPDRPNPSPFLNNGMGRGNSDLSEWGGANNAGVLEKHIDKSGP